jgi:superfamily II DNA or RNA helicase
MTYSVEVRDLEGRQLACDCVDFRINGLGTCKHVEAVLLHLEARFRRLFAAAFREGSSRIDVAPDLARETLRLTNGHEALPAKLRQWFTDEGFLRDFAPEEAVEALNALREELPQLRVSQEVAPWLERRRHATERRRLRHEYELKVQSGEWPAHETKVPLFPYQREGMLHLAFSERALLADEMGLGKTIQAIAACALLQRLGKAQRVLVVTPASLKTEWEEQIQRFVDLPYLLVYGHRHRRLQAYAAPSFFTIVNYEQVLGDGLDLNHRLCPDVVVLDEAQRIKNWNTKTAQAVKRLRSRYAFVLTGTPIENRIDEIHSLMDFLDPAVLGPLFRFNREFYELDERGRPEGYQNLDLLHARIKPYLIRRRKAEVETELPERTSRNHFITLSDAQWAAYEEHANIVARLMHAAKRRPLTKEEHEKLQRQLAMMRMICDSNYILDPDDRVCPKLGELEKILEECRENNAKVIVFSEWERMLELVRGLCDRQGLGYAWHTGSVPQRRRRAEINAFKADPACRVFLSTDSGSTGLNLQNASVVINCDLPWNPARLEQRIARAWRKHQTRPVTIVNLVAENTIEHRMLDTLASKQALADGVLDLKGDLKEIKLRGGRQAFLARLQQILTPELPDKGQAPPRETKPPLPADRALAFAQRARERINGALVRCEERFPAGAAHSVLLVVVDRDASACRQSLESLHEEFFGPGKTDPLAPTHLEVIDRATDEALERLVAAGLVTRTTRATRALDLAASASPPPLSPEERERANGHRAQAGRKLKMARLLCEGGLTDEGRSPLLEAIHCLGRALAVENRLPEPPQLRDALLPPLSHAFQETLPLLRAFVADAAQPWQPVSEAVAPLTASLPVAPSQPA